MGSSGPHDARAEPLVSASFSDEVQCFQERLGVLDQEAGPADREFLHMNDHETSAHVSGKAFSDRQRVTRGH